MYKNTLKLLLFQLLLIFIINNVKCDNNWNQTNELNTMNQEECTLCNKKEAISAIKSDLSKLSKHLNYVLNNVYVHKGDTNSGPLLVQGRGQKTEPWMLIVPLLVGFHFSGIIAIAGHVIKLFMVQAFFASKIAIIIGSYIVLKKLLQLHSTKTKHNHKLLLDEHQVEQISHSQASGPYESAYSISHTAHEAMPDLSHLLGGHDSQSYSASPYGSPDSGHQESGSDSANYEQSQALLEQHYSVHEGQASHHQPYSIQSTIPSEPMGQYSNNINVSVLPHSINTHPYSRLHAPINVIPTSPGGLQIISRPQVVIRRKYRI